MTDADLRLFDGHNDTLLDLHIDETGTGRSFFERGEAGHLDLPRAHEANLGAGLFAVFVPNEDYEYERRETDEGYEMDLPPAVDHERAKSFTYDALARLHRIAAESDGAVRVVGEYADLEACLVPDDGDERAGTAAGDGPGPLAAVPHLEGAEAVAPDLSNLDFLYAAGVRSVGPVWSRPNAFGHGVRSEYPGTPDTGPGLTAAGRDLVRACNDRGILVDLAHATAAGFDDVADLSEDPLVVSHAGVHDICPVSRNLTDRQLDAVADSGGLVGVTFATGHLRPDGENDPEDPTPISTLVDHVEYVADRVGVEHVALGSDFDGATVIDSVGDATGLPDVIRELRDRRFGDEAVRAIARDNWLRVIRETWE
ncbi:dipeptidase [Halorussus gelatinilyticus]|uniref:Dipeptidase n=1 Tax=Halorussus gelatinilyticus TaxID=2937524 RepID=A0A8U0IKI0_9EURY|nr:membrane dipeptidase [Halorussus gelatinilyticus]UPW00559.1 dipeptidase [Halorussus gelatinilyticus]